MAITRVAALQGAAAVDTATGTAAIDVGALSLQEDDFLVVSVVRGDPTTNLSINASANASGALSQIVASYINWTNDTNLWTGYAAEGPIADATIAVSGLGSVAGYCAYIVIQYRGVNTLSPLFSAAGRGSVSGTDKANPALMDTSSDGTNRVVAIYAASQTTSTAWVAPTNINNFIQQTDNGKGRVGVGDASPPGGLFDPDPVTGGDTSGDNSAASVAFALVAAPVTISPTKLTNAQTFYGPTMGAGLIELTASLFTSTQSFLAGTIVSGIAAAQDILITQEQVFFAPRVAAPGWQQGSSGPPGWAMDAGSNLPFDGLVFDLDIFDGVTEFTAQTGVDPNWTRQ